MSDFVAYPSPWRLAVLASYAAAFVAIGLWMAGTFGPLPTSYRYLRDESLVIGWLGTVFFGLCGLVVLAKMFDKREQLRINTAGIRYVPWSNNIIPWSEMTDVTEWNYKGQKAIVLHLRDPALYPGKGLAGLSATANRKLTGGNISILLTGTDRSFDDAMSAIARFRGHTDSFG